MDDDGRIFGVVNIIDALVILFVLAVAIAGISLLGNSGTSTAKPAEPEYAVLTMGPMSDDAASALADQDNLTITEDAGQMRLLETYLTPHGTSDRVVVVAHVKAPRKSMLPAVTEHVDVEANRYRFNASVTALRSTSSFSVDNTTVLVETTVPDQVAQAIDVGDAQTLAGRQVATITAVNRIHDQNGDQRLQVQMNLRTLRQSGSPEFAGRPVRLGTRLPFRNTLYSFTGRVIERGSPKLGTPVDASITVEWENVRPEVADGLAVGMTERFGDSNATVTSVETEPATVIVRSDDGRIYAREHPVNEDVTLTLEATVYDSGRGVTFHGHRLQYGDSLRLDFGSVVVDGIVVGFRTTG